MTGRHPYAKRPSPAQLAVFLKSARGWLQNARRHYWVVEIAGAAGTERDALDQAFARPDVAACLADLLISEPTGPVAKTLRAALRIPALDTHLTRIAHDAIQPTARAEALKVLIDRKASWPSGYGWRWVDKSMGERRYEIVYAERDLTVMLDRDVLIRRGLGDRSATVRRVVLDRAMQHWKGHAELRDYAASL
jgi:hypothetical protein